MVNISRVVIIGTSVLVVMDNIDTVNIIGTVFWWTWTTLAQWTLLAQCFGGHDQHWYSGHHWHGVLVAKDNMGTVGILGTVFWWSWTTLDSGHHWHSVLVAVISIGKVDIIGTVFRWPWATLAK